MTLAVHVTPKAGRDEVDGWRGAELAVRVSAAPEGGKATAAARATVAVALGVPTSRVRVVRGATSRHKLLELDGVDPVRVREVFGPPDGPLF